MEIVKYIVMGIYAVVCVVLIALILKQSKEDSGASGTIVGGASTNNFYEKNKGRTAEGKMKRATILLMIVFAVLTLTLGIIYVV